MTREKFHLSLGIRQFKFDTDEDLIVDESCSDQKLPDFAKRDRPRLVAVAFEGVPKADVILSRLDLDGMPMAVSVDS